MNISSAPAVCVKLWEVTLYHGVHRPDVSKETCAFTCGSRECTCRLSGTYPITSRRGPTSQRERFLYYTATTPLLHRYHTATTPLRKTQNSQLTVTTFMTRGLNFWRDNVFGLAVTWGVPPAKSDVTASDLTWRHSQRCEEYECASSVAIATGQYGRSGFNDRNRVTHNLWNEK
jgi:hypothetical protein